MIQAYIDAETLKNLMGAGDNNRLSRYLGVDDGSDISTNKTLTYCIEMANSTISTFVGSIYTQPFEEVPFILTEIAATLTIYNILKFSRPELLDDDIRIAKQEAMANLVDIREEKLKLTFPAENITEDEVQSRTFVIGHGIDSYRENEFDRIIKEF